MARRHRLACLYGLVVILHSSVTGQLFSDSWCPSAWRQYELTYYTLKGGFFIPRRLLLMQKSDFFFPYVIIVISDRLSDR